MNEIGRTPDIRENLGTGYGLRFSAKIYGSKRERTVFHKTHRVLVLLLQESPKVSGNVWENVI